MMRRKKSLSLALCMLLFASPASAGWWGDFVQLFKTSYQENKKTYTVALVAAGAALGWSVYRSLYPVQPHVKKLEEEKFLKSGVIPLISSVKDRGTEYLSADPILLQERFLSQVSAICRHALSYSSIQQRNPDNNIAQEEQLKELVDAVYMVDVHMNGFAQEAMKTDQNLEFFKKVYAYGARLYQYSPEWQLQSPVIKSVFAWLSDLLNDMYIASDSQDQSKMADYLQEALAFQEDKPLYQNMLANYATWLKNGGQSILSVDSCNYLDGLVQKFQQNTMPAASTAAQPDALYVTLGNNLAIVTVIAQILEAQKTGGNPKKYVLMPYNTGISTQEYKKTLVVPNIDESTQKLVIRHFLHQSNPMIANEGNTPGLSKLVFNEILYPRYIGLGVDNLVLADYMDKSEKIISFKTYLPDSVTPKLLVQRPADSCFRDQNNKVALQLFLKQNNATVFDTIACEKADQFTALFQYDLFHPALSLLPPLAPEHWLFGASTKFTPSKEAQEILFSYLQWKDQQKK